ncbi:MAG: hypothetical protein P8Y18_11920, partial [Candidatus Bathyarchaeota archaeon]
VALIAVYMTRSRKKNTVEPQQIPEATEKLPLSGLRTVTNFDAQKSQKELSLLDVEQEIVSFGIRRIYEAQAEGKITEEERERLAKEYKMKMNEIKDAITENESVVALHELESMQENLIKLFNDRFDEINKKIGGLRGNLNIQPKSEIPKPSPVMPKLSTSSESDKTPRKVKKPSKPKKTEAEERIDQIKSEVEKVLERLGQMETEA